MPKYWREIALYAQEEAAEWFALAQEQPAMWARYMDKAAECYARARWAMEAPGDCP